MDLQLWQWSAAVQWTSITLIAGFFALLGRSFRALELRDWIAAWALNALALTVTVYFWWFQPHAELARSFLSGLYALSKIGFALLALRAAWLLKRPRNWPLVSPPVLLGLVVYAFIAGPLRPIELLGAVQQGAMTVILLLAGIPVLRAPRERGEVFLAAGLLIRGLLAGLETIVYLVVLAPAGSFTPRTLQRAGAFLAAHSFMDTLAEWLLALTVVLALSERLQRELQHANRELRIRPGGAAPARRPRRADGPRQPAGAPRDPARRPAPGRAAAVLRPRRFQADQRPLRASGRGRLPAPLRRRAATVLPPR